MTGVCYLCGGAASLTCPAPDCDVVYCDSEHGALHRTSAGRCAPVRVEERGAVGRVMVTARTVVAGEELYSEEAVVAGPQPCLPAPVCSVCCAPGPPALCPGCGYPVCGADCAGAAVHAEECAVLSRAEEQLDWTWGESEPLHCLLPLRLLLLSRSNSSRAALALDRLMDHEEERRAGPDWAVTERTVVRHLLSTCQAATLIPDLTQQEIRRAVGVLEINSYEVQPGVRACFPLSSLLSHSCVANSRHIWSQQPPYTNTCIATVDLAAGEEVLATYTIPTSCTFARRTNLRAGWFFDCACARCESSSELGTEVNTVVCPDCCMPALRPLQPLQYGGTGRVGSVDTEQLRLQCGMLWSRCWSGPSSWRPGRTEAR